MKKQVIVGSIIIILGLFIIISNLGGLQWLPNKKGGEAAMESYNATQLEHLIIESSSTNIKLIEADNDETVQIGLFKSSGNTLNPLNISDYVSSKQSDDTLQLEVRSSRKWYQIFNFGGETLHVEIPSNLLKKLTVESKSGNIYGEKIAVEDSAYLETRSGNIQLKHANANTLSTELSSGNLSLEDINIRGGELETKSGNIKILSMSAESLELESISGNIQLDGDVLQLAAESTSGNIDLNLNQITDHSKLKSNSGNIKLSLDTPGSLYVTHDKNSGNTSITKSGFEMLKDIKGKVEGAFGGGEIKLDVKTSSGNFKLN